MKVNQIAEMLNNIYSEIIGESEIITENLSNIVDVGRTITASTQWGENFDKYVGKVIDKVGRIVFDTRTYTPDDLGLMRDSWTYGSILEKVRCDVGDFDSAPTVYAKYFNMKTTFREKICITREQAESAFRSAEDMNRFISMIENRVRMKMSLATESLAYRTECNLIAEKLYSGHNVVNLLKEYHDSTSDSAVTSENCLQKAEFLRFVSNRLQKDKKLLEKPSTLFNDAGYTTFTPPERMKMYAITDFAAAMRTNLYADSFNTEFVKLDGFKEIAYWQGMGTDCSFVNRSTIDVYPASVGEGENNHIKESGVLFMMQDEESALICCETNPVDVLYNPDGRFYKFFYSANASYYNDLACNAIVYTISPYYYIPLKTQPADWGTADYYTLTNGEYTKVSGAFSAEKRYYKKA